MDTRLEVRGRQGGMPVPSYRGACSRLSNRTPQTIERVSHDEHRGGLGLRVLHTAWIADPCILHAMRRLRAHGTAEEIAVLDRKRRFRTPTAPAGRGHGAAFFFAARSFFHRANTACCIATLRSAGVDRWCLASAARRADAERSLAVCRAARASPPLLPHSTAEGFFFAILMIISPFACIDKVSLRMYNQHERDTRGSSLPSLSPH